MRKAFNVYTLVLGVAFLAVASFLDWAALFDLPNQHLVGFAVVLGLSILSEWAAIPVLIGRVQGTYSILFVFLSGSVLFLGPAAATLIAVGAHGFSEFALRRKGAWRASFNVAQHGISAAGAGIVFQLLGGASSPDVFGPSLLAFCGYAATHMVLNLGLVGFGVALDQGLNFLRVTARLAGRFGANMFYDFLVMPLGVAIAWAYNGYWVWGLAGVVLPILLVRGAYLTNFQLQQANRDLLKALVKAIEIRDPYTSGHSVRVQALAARVARMLDLPNKKVDHIETAALLHDVGKIEAIYSDILKKKGGLTDEEMEIIKSHVEKGVELLTSLSSFHSEVIAAVRHHHERYDGSGYPDGLSGSIIPLGARIIKICDAVDAMLSDRPYRKALSLPDVREQLMLFAEREFDPSLVSLFFREDLLEEHSAAVRAGELPPAPQVENPVPDRPPSRRVTVPQ